jgi:hypothetical protein
MSVQPLSLVDAMVVARPEPPALHGGIAGHLQRARGAAGPR